MAWFPMKWERASCDSCGQEGFFVLVPRFAEDKGYWLPALCAACYEGIENRSKAEVAAEAKVRRKKPPGEPPVADSSAK